MEPLEKKVAVLLSCYNGEKFLDDQLHSIFSQIGVSIEMFVWDDRSTDSTLEILTKWQQNGFPLKIFHDQRIGSSKAFLKLLKINTHHEYYAFADQDDIWENNKLSLQLACMQSDKPMLVVSNRSLIDEFGKSLLKPKCDINVVSSRNALVQNMAPGNLQLFNKKLAQIVNSYGSIDVKHYDHWIYLNASVYGEVIFLREKLVQYRLHDYNQIGIGNPKRFTNIAQSISYSLEQIMYLGEHSAIAPCQVKNCEILNYFQLVLSRSIFKKVYIAWFKCSVERKSFLESLIWRFFLPFVANTHFKNLNPISF